MLMFPLFVFADDDALLIHCLCRVWLLGFFRRVKPPLNKHSTLHIRSMVVFLMCLYIKKNVIMRMVMSIKSNIPGVSLQYFGVGMTV